MLAYQPQNHFGRYILQQNQPYYTFGYAPEFSTVFYARATPLETIWETERMKQVVSPGKKSLVITTGNGLQQLREAGLQVTVISSLPAFKVAKMNFKFIDPATRASVCETQVLAAVTRP